ncbi:DUF1356 domain-containing protein, partial [Bacillus thuringiensis]|nr:DUF1356 domain-containing protein [Bacillus thuringiensis]
VALIPLNDERLKRSRTKLYVILAVGICLVIGGLLLFFLYPQFFWWNDAVPFLQRRWQNTSRTRAQAGCSDPTQ